MEKCHTSCPQVPGAEGQQALKTSYADHKFLKTIIPSRKATKDFQKEQGGLK
jgi:hypothetical protein